MAFNKMLAGKLIYSKSPKRSGPRNNSSSPIPAQSDKNTIVKLDIAWRGRRCLSFRSRSLVGKEREIKRLTKLAPKPIPPPTARLEYN